MKSINSSEVNIGIDRRQAQPLVVRALAHLICPGDNTRIVIAVDLAAAQP